MPTTLRSLLLIGLIALLAACTCGATTTAAPPSAAAPSAAAPSAAAPSAAAPSEAAPSEAAADATIAIATNPLGDIIVDAKGMTLYAFTPDTGGVPTCYDDCATAWPALVVTDAASAGTGLDATKVTTVDRTDGTKQVKYGDWPLYYFASDAAAGETKGQGIGGKWFVVDATGALIGQ
jgi:predicted lipoprotein with Yx(FWY)xxD motif